MNSAITTSIETDTSKRRFTIPPSFDFYGAYLMTTA